MNRCPSFRNLILLIVSVFLCATARAGETGKLRGAVRDSTSGEPLVGANIVLLGTTLGPATDANGAYFVNNIPPGTYRVRVSMVGYGTVVYESVRINVDMTTELNALLPSEVISLDKEIVVTARRPVVQKDQTSTRTVVQGSTIVNELRFQAVEQILELQAGVTVGTDGSLLVRGGRTGGTVYQVDGVPLLNPFCPKKFPVQFNAVPILATPATPLNSYPKREPSMTSTGSGGHALRARFLSRMPKSRQKSRVASPPTSPDRLVPSRPAAAVAAALLSPALAAPAGRA